MNFDTGHLLLEQHFLIFLSIVLALALLIPFIRVFSGPTLYDRMAGVGVISSKTMVLLTFVGFLYSRLDMFIDIVLAYSLLNFVSTIAVARYLERRGGTT